MLEQFIIWGIIWIVMIAIVVFVPVPAPHDELVNFDSIYLDEINDMLTPRERQALIDYIDDYAWHYGRLQHIGDEKAIKKSIKEKFNLPEEIFKSK